MNLERLYLLQRNIFQNSENLDFWATFLKQNGRSATKKLEVSAVHLALLYVD